MLENKVNLNFHQTFKPEKQYIGSILNVADNTDGIGVQEISSYTGIPNGKSSGKVEPHIIYANYMGLIEYEKKNGLINPKFFQLKLALQLEHTKS